MRLPVVVAVAADDLVIVGHANIVISLDEVGEIAGLLTSDRVTATLTVYEKAPSSNPSTPDPPPPDQPDSNVRVLTTRDGRPVFAGSATLAQDRARPTAEPLEGRATGLTARESQMIELVTAGLGNKDIARLTHLSINSVKSYIRSAYRKIGVDSRTQAVLWGVHHGLLAETSAASSDACDQRD